MPQIIALDRPLRPALPTVTGNVDYTQFEALLLRLDELLRQSGVERRFLELSLEMFDGRQAKKAKRQARHKLRSSKPTPVGR